jgi:endonuclease YncB( thermonuclease family)
VLRIALQWVVAAIVGAVAASATADVVGHVVAVHDGDTITVLVAGRGIRVRLHAIDAPERGQPFSNASRHALEALVAGREVRIVERGHDGYGRLLGRVHAGALDVNAEQVRLGYAWVFRRFVNDPLLLAFEAEAKAAQRGLWRDPKAVPPWQWRARGALRPTSGRASSFTTHDPFMK